MSVPVDHHEQDAENSSRKIVAGLFMSLDGVVDSLEASPKKWGSNEMNETIAAGVAQADTVLLGPRTYKMLAQFWQHQSDDLPMARFLNHSDKYLVSSTITEDMLEWQPASLIKGNLFEEIMELKQQPGKNIQIPGSPKLVRSLLQNGLLDELRLNICPVVVGSGMRLFDEITNQVPLHLVDSKAYSNGVVGLTYRI
ncbi:dihydrofolate reductase family protein [Paenibacillus sp. B2(2019)]|uniref:dihydrofolate reductase family protein n=1 Tax=Paenibacillus sp. B2(2019) TaxID=2607754 RepID=UPI0011F3FC4B|nr:dihydrofolate reductase family protein [Paenibacillus sp. B2(2019)]KAA1188668.1 dihydrofolate reductase family protein [Paenibacillus sp. B2(2019)]